MNKQLLHLLLAAGVILLFFGCSKKTSNEACTHQAAMDLDAGNYDAVLASSCSDSMQKGAAYFGKAGFDATSVINRFVQANSNQTGGKTNLTFYMTNLVGVVSEATLSNLDGSVSQYTSISAASDSYKDAQFDLSLVSAIQGLSLLKLVAADVTGGVNTSCDINNNTIADSAEAEACALIASINISTGSTKTCKDNTTYSQSPSAITFTGKSGTYTGLTISITGTTTPTCPAQFKRLLNKSAGSAAFAVVSQSDQVCAGSDGSSWPCPIEQNGAPLDLVAALGNSLGTMSGSLISSGSGSSNVQQSMTNIQTQACPASSCTSSSIADYLQTIKK